MMSYHNGANTTNTYRKVVQVELIMDAMGGKFNDGASTALQRKVINESWEEIIPTKETDIFDGWYVDKEYTKKFDFSQPASQSLTIYAKWVEEYTVTIPAKVSLNSDDKLKVAATNNGEKTVEVNLINDPTQLNAESQLLLSNQKDAALKITSQLTWEPMSEQSKWNVLTVAPAENGSSKESVIHLTKPKNARAGSYEGTVTFNITYQ